MWYVSSSQYIQCVVSCDKKKACIIMIHVENSSSQGYVRGFDKLGMYYELIMASITFHEIIAIIFVLQQVSGSLTLA